uniref:Domain of unknown function DB domain-containing protein n=1 Tax=Acrobeloides nanus TaxID=290746 RepID=A0A914DYU4_9BILA
MYSSKILRLLIFGLKFFLVAGCKLNSYSECCTLGTLAQCFEDCYYTATRDCPLLYRKVINILARNEEPSPILDGNSVEIEPKLTGLTVISNLMSNGQYYKQEKMCGTYESDFVPCIGKGEADKIFRGCCEQYVDRECLDLCHYETEEYKALLNLQKVHMEGCKLENISPILYCASQNRNNRKCCEYLNFDENDAGHCMRMCNPGRERINILKPEDLTCLANWNVLMYCHLSGLT